MNTLLAALFTLSVAVPAAAQGSRGYFQKVKAAERRGPAFEVPDEPPNLPEDALERFKDAAREADRHSAVPISPAEWDKAMDAAARALIESLKKPHSNYLDRKDLRDFQQSMSVTLPPGIGVQLKPDAAGAKVDLVMPGGPSEKAGLQDDDVITAVNGVSIAGKSLESIIPSIRGPIGSAVVLTVTRGGQSLQLSVTRGPVSSREMFSKMAAPGIGYVYFTGFHEQTHRALYAAIDALKAQGATKLILDVRFNGGGSLHTVNEMASELLRDGQTIVRWKRQGQVQSEAYAQGNGKYHDMPMVLLVNEGSASASEILAGALKDHNRAVLVGARTFGKGSVQTVVPLMSDFGNSAVKITSGMWFTPNDTTIQAEIDPAKGYEKQGTGGVTPHVEVPVSEADMGKLYGSLQRQLWGRAPTAPDAALDRAIQILATGTAN